jgi:thiol-disulfide isomerase/thioredoxin
LSLALCWTKPVSGDGAEEIQNLHHFYDRVLGSSEPVLVEFLLNACKYCVTFRSVFDEVGAAFAANHSGFKYFKVRHVSALSFNINGSWTSEESLQVDHNKYPEIGKKYDVQKFPEVLLFPANKERSRCDRSVSSPSLCRTTFDTGCWSPSSKPRTSGSSF